MGPRSHAPDPACRLTLQHSPSLQPRKVGCHCPEWWHKEQQYITKLKVYLIICQLLPALLFKCQVFKISMFYNIRSYAKRSYEGFKKIKALLFNRNPLNCGVGQISQWNDAITWHVDIDILTVCYQLWLIHSSLWDYFFPVSSQFI